MPSLKEKMALPPIQHPSPRTHSDRDRNRVRLELRLETAEIIVGKIQDSIAEMDVDDPEFSHLFTMHANIMTQIKRLRGGK